VAETAREEVLKQSLIFSSLNDRELAELTRFTIERHFKPEEFIFWEGDTADYFYIIIEGRIKVIKYSSSGKGFIIAFFGVGEMFGEVAVFEDKSYPASAQTVVDTRILGIKKEHFLSFLGNHPPVALSIISVLGGRLRDAQSRLKDMVGERVEQRLARTMLMLASKMGPTLPFTRQELADMSGTTTESAIRVTSRLKERGIIKTVRGKITILDETKLTLLSEGPPLI
jgi:CRP/FNR family transcriptional regulator